MDAAADPLTLLSLQIDWGADEALADSAFSRLANASPAVTHTARIPIQNATPARPTSMAAAISATEPRNAPSIVAATLEALCVAIRDFPGCGLRDTATNPVLPTGAPTSGLLVIGEPPVAEDDRSGIPFSGPAGLVLDRLLASIGLRRDDILLAPLIPWRPPGNRPPTDAELTQCLPIVHRLICVTMPRRILLTGILPVRALLGGGVTLRRIRGQWKDLQVPGLSEPIPALASSSLRDLKTAADRHAVWADWRLLHRSIHPES